jgi:hypothetical protein
MIQQAVAGMQCSQIILDAIRLDGSVPHPRGPFYLKYQDKHVPTSINALHPLSIQEIDGRETRNGPCILNEIVRTQAIPIEWRVRLVPCSSGNPGFYFQGGKPHNIRTDFLVMISGAPFRIQPKEDSLGQIVALGILPSRRPSESMI